MLVLPVSVALRSPHPPTLKPHPSHCHNNTCRECKREREKKNITPQSQTQRRQHIGVQVKMTGSSPSLPLSTMTAVTRHEKRSAVCIRFHALALVCVRVCVCMLVTPEYAAQVSGKDSRLLEMCSVPGCDQKPAGSGHCSAGNSTPVFWQTLAPPVL